MSENPSEASPGEDLVINAPCAAASAAAPMHDTDTQEAGNGLD